MGAEKGKEKEYQRDSKRSVVCMAITKVNALERNKHILTQQKYIQR